MTLPHENRVVVQAANVVFGPKTMYLMHCGWSTEAERGVQGSVDRICFVDSDQIVGRRLDICGECCKCLRAFAV
jgi:hypothetical protein